MAKKKRHHRRKRSVSAPRKHSKRKRRLGAPIYASAGVPKPRRRKTRHVGTHHKKRRRTMGAPGGSSMGSAAIELLMLTVGGAIGDIGASLGGKMLEGQPMNVPPIFVEGAKAVAGSGIFLAGAVGMSKGAFSALVKGIGLGSVVSGVKGAIKQSGVLPMLGAPADKDLYVILPQNGMGLDKGVIGSPNDRLYGVDKGVIGSPNMRLYGDKSVIGSPNMQLYGAKDGTMEMFGM
jgi:hypothetical protein